MRFSYNTLLLTLAIACTTGLLSGCTGGSRSSVYSGYGYPSYGHGFGYNSAAYNRNYYNNRNRVDQRRNDRVQRINNMSSEQRQLASNRLRQNQSQRIATRSVNRPTRNMGRPRGGGRHR